MAASRRCGWAVAGALGKSSGDRVAAVGTRWATTVSAGRVGAGSVGGAASGATAIGAVWIGAAWIGVVWFGVVWIGVVWAVSSNGDWRKIFSRSWSGKPAGAVGTVADDIALPLAEVLSCGGLSAGPLDEEASSYWNE